MSENRVRPTQLKLLREYLEESRKAEAEANLIVDMATKVATTKSKAFNDLFRLVCEEYGVDPDTNVLDFTTGMFTPRTP